MPLSTYQNDSTCDLGAPLRPYSEKTPHAAAPQRLWRRGVFVCRRVGQEERNGVANGFVMKNKFCFYLARIIACCGASIVAHFARKVRATNT